MPLETNRAYREKGQGGAMHLMPCLFEMPEVEGCV